jgi:hypothetical protein
MNMFTHIDRKSLRVFQSKFFEENRDAKPGQDDREGDSGQVPQRG